MMPALEGFSIVTGLLLGSAVLLCLPLFSELLQVLSSLGRRMPANSGEGLYFGPRLLFLIPAHDEELLIRSCVESVLALDYPTDRFDIHVIADNCRDRTADIARACGAQVLERHEPQNPGKPSALAWALQRLDVSSYDGVVVLDADSVVDPGFALALLDSGPLRYKAVQTYFGLRNEWDTWLTRLAGLLSRLRYEVTYPRKYRAGINCPLTGNGMVLGTELLAKGWRAFSLTENWELYAMFTAEGTSIHLNKSARLFSEEAATTDQGQTQRKRWMSGRWSVFRDYWRQILLSREIGLHQKLDALTELGRPSPILHLGLVIGICGLAVATQDPPGSWIVSAIALLSLTPEITGLISVLSSHPKRTKVILDSLHIPRYLVWRVTITLATLLGSGPKSWKRTDRL